MHCSAATAYWMSVQMSRGIDGPIKVGSECLERLMKLQCSLVCFLKYTFLIHAIVMVK